MVVAHARHVIFQMGMGRNPAQPVRGDFGSDTTAEATGNGTGSVLASGATG